MLVVFAPGSRTEIAARRRRQRPFTQPAAGDEIRAGKRTLRVTATSTRIERGRDAVEHITEVFTRAIAPNVVEMPAGDDSVVAQFLRYHVLVRVFDGDPDAWLAELENRGGDGGDLRFVRWIRSRLRQDPALLASIRKMVDATPFWRVAEA